MKRPRKPRPTDSERLTWLLRYLQSCARPYAPLYVWPTNRAVLDRWLAKSVRAERKGKR